MQYTKEQDKQFENYLRQFKEKYRVKKGEDGIYEIPCKNGDIEPYSLNELCCYQGFKSQNGVNRLKCKLPGYCTITQEAGAELVFKFPNDKLDEIARLVKARYRWIPTTEQKEALLKNIARHKFKKKQRDRDGKTDNTAQIAVEECNIT